MVSKAIRFPKDIYHQLIAFFRYENKALVVPFERLQVGAGARQFAESERCYWTAATVRNANIWRITDKYRNSVVVSRKTTYGGSDAISKGWHSLRN